jgi:hypothetical protein
MPEFHATYHTADLTRGVDAALGYLKETEFHAACREAKAIAAEHPFVHAVTVSSEDGGSAQFPVNVKRRAGEGRVIEQG